ncbi:PREDICTED: ubiquitin carboxyl-terminal hydrolase 36 [Nicrophorus vespilloides]|uniref:Ubiquitin carboxyl-terminal hydrolase n=1 Tax=Nicrophorus vespilloides TaxID=110193 RepID=A0ABM1MWW1_NICVS|nr:PREDICTED: ubiquitin carboxyl-terminal hydrolase 36 [Nicrophorus vespilloides]
MPASTVDPVNAALRTALSKGSNSLENGLDSQLAGSSKKALLSNIEFEPAGSYQSSVLDILKSKYIVLKSADSQYGINKPGKGQNSVANNNMGSDETLPMAKHELFPLTAVQLGWSNTDWAVGAGMVNMGNTCYLNSTLQALFHVPSFANWLVSDKQHMAECEESGGLCIVCAMRKTLQDSQQRNNNSIRPFLIFNKLRVVCRNLIPGRQEDAHEFMRYLVEAMEKSYLNRFKNHTQFDSRIKETTPLNQILGGYLRSAVRCLDCGHVSTTFQHFQDLLLDIRKAQTLDDALEAYFAKEQLDEASYHCEACKKKVHATKQFSLERAPMVLCIQYKRFSVTNNKITKFVQFKQRLELSRYARHRPNAPLVYRLVSMVTHMGPTVNCGHYTAVAQVPCGNFYQFDDSMVRPISHQAVFSTNAYILMYELEKAPMKTVNGTTINKINKPANNVSKGLSSNPCKPHVNGHGDSNNKVYGPELPPAKMIKLEDQNGTVTSSRVLSNGKKKSESSSSSSESESDAAEEKKRKSPPLQLQRQSVAQKSSLKKNNTITKSSSSSQSNAVVVTSTSSSNQTNAHPAKLVPYDYEDDDEDDEETSSDEEEVVAKSGGSNGNSKNNIKKVSTKAATNGEWKVTSSTEENSPSNSSTKRDGQKTATGGSSNSTTVNELLKMSHAGYSQPVSTWNGTRAKLDKEIANERREDRKRALVDADMDVGRVKHVKTNNNSAFKSNPGYNPVQEFHNAKNWGQSSYRQFYNPGGRHRNRRNFHHKNNFHNTKNYRFK